MQGGHGHHHHGHAHHHPSPGGGDARWLIGIGLNGAFVLVEATAGVLGHSMALLADAGHNLSDILALALAGAAAWLARRPASPRRTYGFGKATVLAALVNAVLLIFACGFIAREALSRLSSPTPPAVGLMMAVAAAGVLVNGVTAALFTHGRRLHQHEHAVQADADQPARVAAHRPVMVVSVMIVGVSAVHARS